MSTHTEKTTDNATAVGKDVAKDLSQNASGIVEQVRDVVTDALARLRREYEQNPARTVTIAVFSLAGSIAVITTLARR